MVLALSQWRITLKSASCPLRGTLPLLSFFAFSALFMLILVAPKRL